MKREADALQRTFVDTLDGGSILSRSPTLEKEIPSPKARPETNRFGPVRAGSTAACLAQDLPDGRLRGDRKTRASTNPDVGARCDPSVFSWPPSGLDSPKRAVRRRRSQRHLRRGRGHEEPGLGSGRLRRVGPVADHPSVDPRGLVWRCFSCRARGRGCRSRRHRCLESGRRGDHARSRQCGRISAPICNLPRALPAHPRPDAALGWIG